MQTKTTEHMMIVHSIVSQPLEVLNRTPLAWNDYAALGVQALSAIAAFVAAAIALKIAKDDRRDRQNERVEERKRMGAMIEKVLQPEAHRLLGNLHQLYTTMLGMTMPGLAAVNDDGKSLAMLEWLEGRLRMDATEKFLLALVDLPDDDGAAYAAILGLLPGLLNASQQFRFVPKDSLMAVMRKDTLEYGIGSIATILVKRLKLPLGDVHIGNLQGAIDAYKKQNGEQSIA